jgi:hypothetical protein
MNLENGMTTQSENAILWIEKLLTAEADGIKQGKRQLGDAERGFCCLGYGCFVTEIKYNPRLALSFEFRKGVGLIDSCGSSNVGRSSCASMNDSRGFTFPQIAEQLRDNASSYFIPSVSRSIKEHFA